MSEESLDDIIKRLSAESRAPAAIPACEPTAADNEQSVELMVRRGYSYANPELFKTLVGYYSRYRLERTNKGLALFGANGIGKTYFFKRMIGAKLIKCRELVELNKESPEQFKEFLQRQAYLYDVVQPDHLELIVDEVGEEQPLNNFGNKYEVFAEVLDVRHRLFESHQAKTFFTSNLSKKHFGDRYGSRCVSRINEMCYMIDATGEDLRG